VISWQDHEVTASDSATPKKDTVRDTRDGDGWLAWSWRSTALLVVVLFAGVIDPSTLGLVAALVSLAMFGAGIILFLWSYALAVARSRTEDVSVVGLYLLSEGAPRRVRRSMLASLTVQTVAAIIAASVRPFTALAFGLLAQLLGLGLVVLGAAKHGVFRDRPPKPPRRRAGEVATRTRAEPREDVTITEDRNGAADA
jgi:hypothetical protein